MSNTNNSKVGGLLLVGGILMLIAGLFGLYDLYDSNKNSFFDWTYNNEDEITLFSIITGVGTILLFIGVPKFLSNNKND